MNKMKVLSKIFQPYYVIPKEFEAQQKGKNLYSRSAKLMLELGIIRQSSPGCFSLLPLGIRSLNKLITIIDREMEDIGGQKMEFPTLINQKLWSTSGRINTVTELYKLKDRQGHDYLLGPTHEEVASELLSHCQNSYKNFPLLLYQITNKFRDELRPKCGLIRSKQFLMKDMYSFDVDYDNAMKTYHSVCESYDRIFRKLGMEFHKSQADMGIMGGLFSHEYHFKAGIGDDTLLQCANCNDIMNAEVVKEDTCPKCGNMGKMNSSKGIEVGHTFLLGDRYTKPFSCNFTTENGNKMNLHMGCYGLGITRILAASIETLSTHEEIRWPKFIAPYSVLIIPPKANSFEEHAAEKNLEMVYNCLDQIPQLQGEVVVDDRTNMTIGRRNMLAKRIGYPFIVVIGKGLLKNPAVYELHDIMNDKHIDLTLDDLMLYLKNNYTIQD